MSATAIDLNGDVGEGMASDAELIPLLTSVNIACGGHVGDEGTMGTAVEQAIAAGAAIGAHPSLPDREHFGRREISARAEEIERWVREQILALAAVARCSGTTLEHVKPHGALYNLAARDAAVAEAIVNAIRAIRSDLVVVALSGSLLVRAARARGMFVAEEGFVDRAYLANGTLAPRSQPGAMLDDGSHAIQQAVRLARGEPIATLDGGFISPRVDTLCIHGDRADVTVFTRNLRGRFAAEGIVVRRFSSGPG